MKIIGVDPGQSGAIAIVTDLHNAVAHPMAKLTEQDIWTLLSQQRPAVAILEAVHSSPQMGVRSAFTFGASYGMLRMAIIASGLRMETVTPQRWQKLLGIKSVGAQFGSAENKRRNKAKAQELFPDLKITHATADALLLAEYGRLLQGVAA